MVSFAPSRQDLDALLARRQGDLRDEPYRLLLLALATRGKSGVLTLTRGPLEKEVVFDSGAAIDCQSNIATETLGRFLVSSGRISEAQYRDALSAPATRGLEQLLPAAELSRAVQQSLGRRLLEPFSWTSGTWQFSPDAPLVEAAQRVRIPQLIVTGIGKVEPFETIETALQDAGATQLTLGSSPLFDASELRLSEDQQRVLGAIRNGTTLDQITTNEDLQRFVFALLLLGIAVPTAERAAPFFELDIAPEEPPRSAGSPSTALRAGQPAAPPASSRPEPPQFASANDLLAAHATFRQQDPFALLGLDSTAGAVEINRAFIRTAERFLPSRYEEQVRDKAQDLFLAAARAYAELADPSRRQALIDRRGNKPAVATPAPEPPPPPRQTSSQRRRAIIDPEQLYREGRAAAAAGKLRDALGYFEMAADCDAQNGAYAAEVAYARYQLLISPAPATIKALKNAVRIDPRCGVAYLYLGKIQETLGNKVEAQAYLGRASMLGAR